MTSPCRLLPGLLAVLLGLTAGCSSPQKPSAPATPTASPVATPASATTTAPMASFLKVHNDARKAVGVPPLQWNNDLAVYAQEWANHLASQGGNLVHRTSGPYGENLSGGRGSAANPTRAAENWLTERNGYVNQPFGNNDESGHYTAMVWGTTTHVGYGTATSADGTWVVVANYSPRGNIVGQYPYR